MLRIFYKIMCLILLPVLGFGACDFTEDMDEYGSPYATYKVSGSVVSALTGEGIQGIKIYFSHYMDDEYDEYSEFSYVDGTWYFEAHGLDYCWDDCEIVAEDIDGRENGGLFTKKIITLEPEKTEKGSSVWDEGTFEQHDIEIRMEKASVDGGQDGGGPDAGTEDGGSDSGLD